MAGVSPKVESHIGSGYSIPAVEWTSLMAEDTHVQNETEISSIRLREMTNHERDLRSAEDLKQYENIITRDFSVSSADGFQIPIRVYTPAGLNHDDRKAVYIWIHGGGFLFGTLNGEDSHCYSIANKLNVVVVNICYRHTPEWQWPVPAEDASTAVDWVFDNMDRINGDRENVIIAGRSAGALLAARITLLESKMVSIVSSTAEKARTSHVQQSRSRIRGQVLDIPLLCHTSRLPDQLKTCEQSSYIENKDAPILPAKRLVMFESLLGDSAREDPMYNILCASDEDVIGMPPTHFHIAGMDILRDQAFEYMWKLERNGSVIHFCGTDLQIFTF